MRKILSIMCMILVCLTIHAQFSPTQNKAQEDYINSHKYYKVPFGNNSIYCEICKEYINSKDIYSTLGIRNDSIYYMTAKKGDLGLSYPEFHKSKIPQSLNSDKDFLYHYEAFKDSLTNDSIDYAEFGKYLEYEYGYVYYWTPLKKIAPFGYVNEWSWDCKYSMVTFNIQYTNTNTKTIKYLTFYFKITNDVGDIRKTGYFQGTGPLKEGDTGSWNWDSSSYFTAGDSSQMFITKIILTYMNGTKRVVSGKYLQFN